MRLRTWFVVFLVFAMGLLHPVILWASSQPPCKWGGVGVGGVACKGGVCIDLAFYGDPDAHSPASSGVASYVMLNSSVCKKYIEALGLPHHYHRKYWEFCVMLRILDERFHLLRPNARGVGFAVGQEPLASYFVSRGCDVVVSDMPLAGGHAVGWNKTKQFANDLAATWKKSPVPYDTYMKHAVFTSVDMNHIPDTLQQRDFDFAWSTGSFEHAGTCAKAVDVFKKMMGAVRPGGISVHATELRISTGPSADIPGTCFFSKQKLEDAIADLEANGHHVLAVDWRSGTRMNYDTSPFFSLEDHIKWRGKDHIKVLQTFNGEDILHTSVVIAVQAGVDVRPKTP